jgi:TolA-binding protein
MAEEKNICASCGSAQSPGATVCDICGHDLTEIQRDVETPPVAETPLVMQEPAKAPRSPQAKQQKKQGSSKAGTRIPSRVGGPLFSTMQWVAITVAAFILGGVITASFLPAPAGNPAEMKEETGMTQGTQPNLQVLNAAKAAVDANPEDAGAILAYANALHDAGMADQAIVQYKSYLEKNPDDPDARVDLGICYFEKQEYDAAISAMERAVADHPDHQLGTYNLGIVNLNAGNKEKAREWFTRARDMNPESPHGKNAAQLLREHF